VGGPLIYLILLLVGARSVLLLTRAWGTRGTRGGVGSLFGGPFIFIGEILTCLVGVFLVAIFLL